MWLPPNLVQQNVRLDMTDHTVHYTTLIRNHAEAVKVIFSDIYGSSRQKETTVLMKLCSHSTCFGVVSFDADYPVGFILLQQAADTADIIELGVRASVRRQGIGRHLLEQGLRLANEHGIKRVMLDVEVNNKVAYKLYRSAGFELVGKRPNYYQRKKKSIDSLILERHSD
ncbi:MAG: hypothetical protein CMM80_02020 [Rhodospirillaceae bacterium]|nr:hypothetical protein [Rhodospirillaceae bacterium]